MSVEVLIPWRGRCPHRRRALDWVTARYRWPVTLAVAPAGPWCKAAALEAAVAESTADILVIADADVWCDGTPVAVDAVRGGAPWAVPHTRVRRLTRPSTRWMLAGHEPDPGYDVEERPYRGIMGGGLTVLPREIYQQVPLDRRFTGWGQEDISWGIALGTLAGSRWRGTSDLVHLWHPPQERLSRRVGSEEGLALHRRYQLAQDDPAAMTALIEEARCLSPLS